MTEPENATTAEEVVPGFWTLVHVWWSITWRSILWLALAEVVLFIFFFVVGMVGRLAGVDLQAVKPVLKMTGFIMGMGCGIWSFVMAFRAILGKSFSGCKLLFLKSA